MPLVFVDYQPVGPTHIVEAGDDGEPECRNGPLSALVKRAELVTS